MEGVEKNLGSLSGIRFERAKREKEKGKRGLGVVELMWRAVIGKLIERERELLD